MRRENMMQRSSQRPLLDRLVGGGQQRFQDNKAEGLEVAMAISRSLSVLAFTTMSSRPSRARRRLALLSQPER
jgi:hypothetical protein